MVMVLSKPDAVMGWRSLIGPVDPEKARKQDPNSLRAIYGKSALENALHGSSDVEHAQNEMEQLLGSVKISPDGSLEGVKESQGGE